MLALNRHEVFFEHFPNGESFADINKKYLYERDNEIQLRFESDEDITHLLFLKDFVDNFSPVGSNCNLIMPYIPYSRMDRKEEDRLFTLKSFAKFINALNFDRVVVMEPHSDVSVALLNRTEVINVSAMIAKMAMRSALGLMGDAWLYDKDSGIDTINLMAMYEKAKEAGIYFVFPDAGAEKRYSKQLQYEKILSCTKLRDFNTGHILKFELNGSENARDCRVAIIIDDLCSKGGTFMGASTKIKELLPNIEKIILCVTHCENTVFNGNLLYDSPVNTLYTTNSILSWTEQERFYKQAEKNKDKLFVFDFKEFLN